MTNTRHDTHIFATKTIWHQGEQCQYTGNSQVLHGARFFELKILDGCDKGKFIVSTLCPECDTYDHDNKALPCANCTII